MLAPREATWAEFSATAFDQMRRFKNGELSLKSACAFTDLEKYKDIELEVRDFVCNAFANEYMDLENFDNVMQLFGAKATEEEFARYMNS